MAEATIKDGATVKYVFPELKSLLDTSKMSINKMNADGQEDPIFDHNKTIGIILQLTANLIPRGAYDSEEDPGTTGTIYKQKSLLKALRQQAANENFYYTLFLDFDPEDSGTNGVVETVLFDHKNISTNKIEATVVFLSSSDVFNF